MGDILCKWGREEQHGARWWAAVTGDFSDVQEPDAEHLLVVNIMEEGSLLGV